MNRCHACKKEWIGEKRQPGFKETCEGCGAYLHCCINCTFHDPSAHNQCRIPTTDWVGDRIKCNFCEEFTFVEFGNDSDEARRKAKGRDAVDRLFGDAAPREERGKDAFDKLFGD